MSLYSWLLAKLRSFSQVPCTRNPLGVSQDVPFMCLSPDCQHNVNYRVGRGALNCPHANNQRAEQNRFLDACFPACERLALWWQSFPQLCHQIEHILYPPMIAAATPDTSNVQRKIVAHMPTKSAFAKLY